MTYNTKGIGAIPREQGDIVLRPELAELAELYWKTGSVKFGEFRLTAHQADPTLPPSPVYLSTRELPADAPLLQVVGGLLGDLVFLRRPTFDFIGNVPSGADPLTAVLMRELGYEQSGKWQLRFSKRSEGGQTTFALQRPKTYAGEILLAVDDHTSGGYNAGRFIEAARSSGLRVTDYVCVVDREQGAEGYLDTLGVKFHKLLTLSEMLEYYVERGYISQAKADEVAAYISANQFWP